jgi:hypothetical protein
MDVRVDSNNQPLRGTPQYMIYHRHVDEFLVFPVRGVGLSPQDLRFFPADSVAFFVRMLGEF